jgi:hypothetical protein
VTSPIIAPPDIAKTALEVDIVRLASSGSGSIGSGARRSTKTKASASKADAGRRTTDATPSVPRRSATTAAERIAAPARSRTGFFFSIDSCSAPARRNAESRPKGTLT